MMNRNELNNYYNLEGLDQTSYHQDVENLPTALSSTIDSVRSGIKNIFSKTKNLLTKEFHVPGSQKANEALKNIFSKKKTGEEPVVTTHNADVLAEAAPKVKMSLNTLLYHLGTETPEKAVALESAVFAEMSRSAEDLSIAWQNTDATIYNTVVAKGLPTLEQKYGYDQNTLNTKYVDLYKKENLSGTDFLAEEKFPALSSFGTLEQDARLSHERGINIVVHNIR